MDGSFNAVFFVRVAPTYELIEDHVHVCYEVGQVRTEFVLTRNKFLKAYRAACKIVDAINNGESSVVAFAAEDVAADH